MDTGSVVKYVGAALSLVGVVLSAVANTRDDKTNRLTRAGKSYVALIILGGLCVFATQALDESARAHDVREELKRHRVLLDQILRAEYPLREVRLSCYTTLPPGDPSVVKYAERLAGEVPSLENSAIRLQKRDLPGVREWGAAGDHLVLLILGSESALFPHASGPEARARQMAERAAVRLLFYREPVDVREVPLFVWTGAQASQPDVEMYFAPVDPVVDFRPQNRQVRLMQIGLETNPRSWESSGRIVSLFDLTGSQMFLDLHPRRSDDPALASPELDTVEINVGPLGAIWLPKARFIEHRLPNGDVIYEFRFPKEPDEVLSLQRRYGKTNAPLAR